MSTVTKNWKSDAALRTYMALRKTNPHLPTPDLVTPDEIDIHTGGQAQLASVTLRVLITLPESWADDGPIGMAELRAQGAVHD